MLDVSALREMRPFIATPSHRGVHTSSYTRGLLALSNAAWVHGFSMCARFLDGDAVITRARNELVAEFLADSGNTHLLWIDDDIGFEAEAALRLMLAGKEVVAGACPKRVEHANVRAADDPAEQQPPIHDAFNVVPLPGAQMVDADGYVQVQAVGAGFMLIARSVLEAMIERFPGLNYADHSAKANPSWVHWRYRFFDVGLDPESGEYVSEDFAFCRRWRSMGGQVWVDTQSDLEHTGAKAYRRKFSDVLLRAC